MTSFRCKSRDAAGAVNEQTLTAVSRREAIQQLQAKGMFPITIDEVRGRVAVAESGAPRPGSGKGVKARDLGRFTDQLASLMGAGVPILTGIAAVGEQTDNDAFRAVLKCMYGDVKGGMSLSGAMQRHPGVFPEAYVNSVAAGEASGTLEQFLANLADFIEADLEVRSDVRGALLYPAILISTLGLAVTVLIVFVVPRFGRLYGNAAELPLPTRILMGTSAVLSEYLVGVLAGLALLVWGTASYARTEAGRQRLDGWVLRIPIVGRLIDTAITLRVMQMMGLFQQAGMPVIEALKTISRTVSNRRVRRDMEDVSAAVASGESLSGGMQMVGCFSPSVRQMIASGESTGSLERSYSTVARQLKKELRQHTKNLATAIEPILTLFLAVIVLFVALAAFLPMWNLAQVMRH